jgi:Heterokaryon incompatibility protein (HET)
VQGWLAVCLNTHKSCQTQSSKESLLPKRVIDIHSPRVKLHETRNEYGRYACLSHCWGSVRPSCRTTSATLEANQRGIDWDTLPATFQDAIDFTRRLGLQYIWIDSICIVQDNLEDWKEQSSLMPNIYENAYITLCATGSSDDSKGCYLPASYNEMPQKIHIKKKDGPEYDVYFRCHLASGHPPSWTVLGFRGRYFPLMSRAWAYQERLMSPRLVHFAHGNLLWECSELSDCECYPGETEGDSPHMSHLREKMRYREFLNGTRLGEAEVYWREIVSIYSNLELSLKKDKLPALSGVAKQISKLRLGDEYLAGLWRKTIIGDLGWRVGAAWVTRLSVWRSPSWSWASVEGLVAWGDGERELIFIRAYCDCLEASVTPSGSDTTGEVLSGYIILSALVILVQVHKISDSLFAWDSGLIAANGLKVKLGVDCYNDYQNGSISVGDSLHCLRLGSYRSGKDFCLVLKRREQDGMHSLYERVGWCFHSTNELEKHWFTPQMEKTIVKIV